MSGADATPPGAVRIREGGGAATPSPPGAGETPHPGSADLPVVPPPGGEGTRSATVVPLDASARALTRPDLHLVAERGGLLVGRLSVWWSDPPRPEVCGDAGGAVASPSPAGVGRVGHAAWAEAGVGVALLDAACARLAEAGCTRVVGPLDGSTWHAYRVVTDAAPGADRWGRAAEPAFALEPAPPAVIATGFEQAGFEPVERYVSTRIDVLPDEVAEVRADRERLAAEGITIRPFDAQHAEDELRRLHPALLRAFADNPYFAPISEADFLALYRPLLAHADPGLILLAERDAPRPGGAPVGVVLGLPDVAQAGRGEAIDTVVVKTLAVVPEARGLGLGGALVRAVHEAAQARGLTRAVHALMHVDNRSVGISERLPGRVIRRYALLGRDLPAPTP